MKWYYKILTALPVICLLFAGCDQRKKHVQENMPGMSAKDMVKKKSKDTLNLSSLLKATNEFVLSSIPVTPIEKEDLNTEVNVLGVVGYDMRQVGTISAWVSGRIEKLYIKYRYQKIMKGEKVMTIYSPELMTAQENLLFLMKNDPSNTKLINDTKERLTLLGIGNSQIQTIINTQKLIPALTIYSSYSGHIHEADVNNSMGGNTAMIKEELVTEPISVKEGMYVQKGQQVFSIYNPDKSWILLSIYPENQSIIKAGNAVLIVPEAEPNKELSAKIDFIEPFFRKDSKTLTARVYFDNSKLQLPVGSQVRAIIHTGKQSAFTLPEGAVVSLGLDKIVFKKVTDGFKAKKVETGNTYNGRIVILSGLATNDSVAVNAQFLMDSESFIKVDKQ
jgi:Cu(I)/Ag(I) efflux system membrane fusion protein